MAIHNYTDVYQQIENSERGNQIHRFTIDHCKFILNLFLEERCCNKLTFTTDEISLYTLRTFFGDRQRRNQACLLSPVTYTFLSYRHEYFNGKCTTLRNYIRDSSGVFSISSLVRISMISLISRLFLILFLNSLVYDRNIFGTSSKVFSNLRNFSGIFGNRLFSENVRQRSLTFGQVLESLRKSSEGDRKSSENRQKRRHQDVYIIKRTLHVSSMI